jgi:thymidylate synthase (FAD)
MMIRLISHTQSPILEVSPENLVAYCARVSNPDNQEKWETGPRLIQYLIEHKHWSPFEMYNVCLEIRTTRDIARQILRHRSFSFQEFSQRYADPLKLGYVFREARLQDLKNRQNSIESASDELKEGWEAEQARVMSAALDAYQWAVERGIAKEVARAVLPEGMMETVLFVNGSLRSWIHYIEVRTDPSTQKEHRMVAEACAKEIANLFPVFS